MKMKRLLASVLALLLMVSLLPMTALAAEVGDNSKRGTVSEIESGNTMNNNSGTVTTNNGNLNHNLSGGEVVTNNKEITINHTGGTVNTNASTGKITENWGTVNDNSGKIKTNEAQPTEDKAGVVVVNNNSIETNKGTVGKKDENGNAVAGTGNNGTIETNNGTVITNNKGGTVGKKDTSGKAVAGTGNNGTIETNNGTVITNNEDGTVETNAKDGKIETNEGTVGAEEVLRQASESVLGEDASFEDITKEKANAIAKQMETKNSGNFGTITDNKGEIYYNGTDGFIETNNNAVGLNNGTVKTNNVYVGLNNGTVETNNSHVRLNNGTVETNNMEVYQNTGKVDTNNGGVYQNTGTVKSNDFVAHPEDDNRGMPPYGVVIYNDGSVETNNGWVYCNGTGDSQQGVIDENHGAIFMNYGTVKTNGLQLQYADGRPVEYEGQTMFGRIEHNFGTVETNAIDGFVGNYSTANFDGPFGYNADSSKEKPDVLQGTVEYNFGTVHDFTECVKEDDKPTIYYGLSWGENTDHLNLIDGAVKAETVKNLDEIARSVTRDGYRMTGYTAYSRKDGKDTEIREETNHYTMKAPTWLKILWEKIVTAVESNEPEAKPEKKTSIPTSLSADQVKVGAYVRRGNLLFRIIEVGDDSIRVATVSKLSEQALADMLGFLKQHLSDAQIAKINGEPELLEQELVTYFFGGTSEHIAFYAARDLFA